MTHDMKASIRNESTRRVEPARNPRAAALTVVIPQPSASITFRAYEATVADVSLLGWLVARLKAGLSEELPIVCSCRSPTERERVIRVVRADDIRGLTVLAVDGDNELARCRWVMEHLALEHMVVAQLGHLLYRPSIMRDLLHIHRETGAQLTEAISSGFVEPLFVVAREFVEMLLREHTAHTGSMLQAVMVFQRQQSNASPGSSRNARVFRFDVDAHCRLDATTLPEAPTITSARDVEIYLEMIRRGMSSANFDTDDLLSAFKSATAVVRRRRLAHRHLGDSVPSTTPKRLRVLYASSISTFTGAQQSLCHLIGAMSARGVECYALTSYEGTFTTLLRQNGARVVCPNHNIARNDPENFVYAVDVLATIQPDIVHVNHTVGLPTLNAALAAGIPLVQHARFQSPWIFREHFYAADAVIAVSEYVKSQVKRLDIDPSRIDVIMNGINIEQFAPAPTKVLPSRKWLGIPEDAFVVLLIARLARNKRHDVVIEAVGRLRRATGRGHLLMVGTADGDQAFLQELLEQSDRDGLHEHMTKVHFLPDILMAHNASNVVALPSENEPLSRAILEGMALALPVVVGDSGGTKEIIVPKVNGFVVPCGDAVALGDVLIALAQNPRLACSVGEAARNTIQSSLTASHCAERTAAVYERVLQQRSTSSTVGVASTSPPTSLRSPD